MCWEIYIANSISCAALLTLLCFLSVRQFVPNCVLFDSWKSQILLPRRLVLVSMNVKFCFVSKTFSPLLPLHLAPPLTPGSSPNTWLRPHRHAVPWRFNLNVGTFMNCLGYLIFAVCSLPCSIKICSTFKRQETVSPAGKQEMFIISWWFVHSVIKSNVCPDNMCYYGWYLTLS